MHISAQPSAPANILVVASECGGELATHLDRLQLPCLGTCRFSTRGSLRRGLGMVWDGCQRWSRGRRHRNMLLRFGLVPTKPYLATDRVIHYCRRRMAPSPVDHHRLRVPGSTESTKKKPPIPFLGARRDWSSSSRRFPALNCRLVRLWPPCWKALGLKATLMQHS